MDISKYWLSVKKQSKELTGVSKISAGIFHGSGIASSLESYIKAVDSGNEKKIQKSAASALKKTEKYLNTVHKKEVATGKKAMTKEQLKSASIVSDALEKIIAQLQDVVSGKADAGSFDRDSEKDVYDKVMAKAEAHVDMRIRVAKDAKGYLTAYKKLAAPVPKLEQMGKKYAKEAEKTKKSGSMMENMNAISLANRALDEIKTISAKIETHYSKHILSGKSEFMQCRQDFKTNDMPKQYVADYKKRQNAAWKPVTQAAEALNKVRHDVKAAMESASEHVDVAEGFSMKGKDPAKQLEKINEVEKAAIKVVGAANTASDRVENAPMKLEKAMGDKIPAGVLAKTVSLLEPEVKKRMGQFADAEKSAKKLKARVVALAKGVEGDAVPKAASKVDTLLDEINTLARKVATDYKLFTTKMVEAKKKLAKETQDV